MPDHDFRLCLRAALLVHAGLVTMAAATFAADPPATKSNYADDVKFLSAHAPIIELTDGKLVRVAVSPDYQGRVMTSSATGEQGASYGWINREFITAPPAETDFNNYGGEDRFWLAPEAGQFAFYFKPGAKQEHANWFTQPGLDEGAFRVVSREGKHAVKLSHRLKLENASKTNFDLEVAREVRLLNGTDLDQLFGAEAVAAIKDPAVKSVGFATENTITNRGPAMSRESGLVSIWTLGQFPPGAKTVIIAPYRPGDDAQLGPVVTPDYFGPVPLERLTVSRDAVLFLGDGHFRAKIGISPRRARPVGGSYDFANHVLTIVSYTLPKNAADHLYVNNAWELPQSEPFRGDAFNSYNDGPATPGAKAMGGFYELETVSPTRVLATSESLSHTHRTLHFTGDPAALARLAKLILGVDLAKVEKTMFRE